jgi:hypothetical protein|tara:strand:+ start:2063 stop:2503 length:441 start_codon:yes stop_codon:yes gene_type:complete
MLIRVLGNGLLLGLLVAVPMEVLGHHAFSSEFDANRPFTVEGVVVKVEWVNPHAWIHVDVALEDGTTQSWMMEAGTPNTLLRRGFTRTLLLPGTEVVVRGYQSKDASCQPKCHGAGRDITFADGRSLFMGTTGTGAPPDGADPKER